MLILIQNLNILLKSLNIDNKIFLNLFCRKVLIAPACPPPLPPFPLINTFGYGPGSPFFIMTGGLKAGSWRQFNSRHWNFSPVLRERVYMSSRDRAASACVSSELQVLACSHRRRGIGRECVCFRCAVQQLASRRRTH